MPRSATKPSARRVPFPFVLEALTELEPRTRPLFSTVGVYVGEAIMLALRERPTHLEDNGVWVATTVEHHASLRRTLPGLRSIGVLGGSSGRVTGWQVIPKDSEEFEGAALRACELILAGDRRIGKVPPGRRASGRLAALKPGSRSPASSRQPGSPRRN